MTPTFRTPGVYVEEISALPPTITGVDTAVPAFIGYTQKADRDARGDLHLKPTRIGSLVEYERWFGMGQPERRIRVAVTLDAAGNVTQKLATLAESQRSMHSMHRAVQMYFMAGGGPCYIVSVNRYRRKYGSPPDVADLQAGLDALGKEQGPTLIVFPEAQRLPIAQFKALHDAALAQCATLRDRFVIMDLHGGDGVSLSDPNTRLGDAVATFRAQGIGDTNLQFGAVYAPNLQTTLPLDVDEIRTAVTVTAGATTSSFKLAALKNTTPVVYAAAKDAIAALPCTMPPAAAMAGLYASNDNTRGVWKAPANLAIPGGVQPTLPCTDADQDDMNVDATAGKSVNAIRTFPGKGTLVWGARTLAGNDNEWRYVNIRRLFIFIEQSVQPGVAQAVLEPNDANTWTRLQAAIENFLTTLWRQGALQGMKPEHAFYVAVGLGRTMTQQDILDGRLIVEIGVAAVRPAEFIVLRIVQMMAQV